MKEKKTTKRLLPMMELEDLRSIFDIENDMTLMRRRRDGGASEKTNPWEDFDEKEGINTQLYVYEMQSGPQLRLNGKRVQAFSKSGEELEFRPLEYARIICLAAQKYKEKRAKAPLILSEEDQGLTVVSEEEMKVIQKNEHSYEIFLYPRGEVRVGCQPFPWEEIDAFAKKMGWWK